MLLPFLLNIKCLKIKISGKITRFTTYCLR